MEQRVGFGLRVEWRSDQCLGKKGGGFKKEFAQLGCALPERKLERKQAAKNTRAMSCIVLRCCPQERKQRPSCVRLDLLFIVISLRAYLDILFLNSTYPRETLISQINYLFIYVMYAYMCFIYITNVRLFYPQDLTLDLLGVKSSIENAWARLSWQLSFVVTLFYPEFSIKFVFL